MFNTTAVSASLSATLTATFGPTTATSGPLATNPTNASTRIEGGQAVFENDNYRITAGDNNEIRIHNKNTGENYRIWGDPHVDIDGKHTFDFWGTTTFQLDDGTKLTVETVTAGNDMTLASKMTITNGDYAAQISGIDTHTRGDLKVDEGKGWGVVLDAAVDDGNVLHENGSGKGFVAVDSNGQLRQVDQAYINKTDLMKGGALSQTQIDAADLFSNAFSMSGLVSVVLVGALLRSIGSDDAGAARGNGGGRMWAGGSPTFDESTGSHRGLFNLSLNLDVSFSLTLTRWNG